jgi:hypothetical protein
LNDEVTVISLKTFTVADHYSKTEADTLLAAKATVANFTSTGIDDNATSTAVTIDASENVLVGQTSLNTANNGHSFGANGNYAHHTSTESTTLILNRKTSDGDIVRLRKDNVAVGSIGTYGSALYIASPDGSDAGLRIGNSYISPVTTTGVNRDAGIDLGHSNSRFKDLYLSNGIKLGGTGAANTQDDYEEGTWTGVCTWATQGTGATTNGGGTYTKIGDTVHAAVYLQAQKGNASGNFHIAGLPFAATDSVPVSLRVDGMGATSKVLMANTNNGNTNISFLLATQSTSYGSTPTPTNMHGTVYIQLQVTYRV